MRRRLQAGRSVAVAVGAAVVVALATAPASVLGHGAQHTSRGLGLDYCPRQGN
jgi:hypothetical protein